jgi:hypothetical protein
MIANRTLKFRRDEVAAALVGALARYPESAAGINEAAGRLGLEDYSEIAADYNTLGALETSRLAALANLPKSGTQRERVFLALYRHPSSDQEIETWLRIPSSSARTRRAELVAGGWVEASAERRRTECENDAIVWRLSVKGEHAAAIRANTIHGASPEKLF